MSTFAIIVLAVYGFVVLSYLATISEALKSIAQALWHREATREESTRVPIQR